MVKGLLRASQLQLYSVGWAEIPKASGAGDHWLVCAKEGSAKPVASRPPSVTEMRISPEGIYHGAKLLALVNKGLIDANSLRDGSDGYLVDPVIKALQKHPARVVVVSLKGETSLRVWLSLQLSLAHVKKHLRLGRCL